MNNSQRKNIALKTDVQLEKGIESAELTLSRIGKHMRVTRRSVSNLLQALGDEKQARMLTARGIPTSAVYDYTSNSGE